MFFSLKSVFPQKCLKFNKRLIIIWVKGTFLFAQLCSIVARTWRPARSEHIFLGTKTWFSTQKSIFCHTTPNFVYSPFVALRETVHFPSWDRFFVFSFPSYSRLRKKKNGRRGKSLPPPYCTMLLLSTRILRYSKFSMYFR